MIRMGSTTDDPRGIQKTQSTMEDLQQVTHGDTFLGVWDVFVTEILEWQEAKDAIVQLCLHSHCLARTLARVKVVPHLQTDTAHVSQTHTEQPRKCH